MNRTILVALAALCPLAACDLDVPDLNNPAESVLIDSPTPSLVRAAAVGLIIGNRTGYAESNGYISLLGILGREAYSFEADPRFVTELLAGRQLDPGSPEFGGNLWTAPYANIRNANVLLLALERVAGFSEPELAAFRGFAQTMQALDYLVIVNTRDVNGGALATQVSRDELPPLVSREELFAHIEQLLDQGHTHLQQASPEFPFDLPSGFQGFDTPATFMRFNRAIKARVDVYTKDYQAAMDSLAASFIQVDEASPSLDLGVYHVYGTRSGDTQNELISNNIFAHPSLIEEAEEGDIRAPAKIRTVMERTVLGLTSSIAFSLYPDPISPVPIIRNEELILLRAEASFELGAIEDAIADLNFIRVHSGGLAPRDDLDETNFYDELLYQRRYGLLFEGHRWLDMRRLGRLEELPLDRQGDVVHTAFPIPLFETEARQ